VVKLAALVLLSVTSVALPAPAEADRPSILLDGKWDFRFGPDQNGPFDRVLDVPGSWDAQGVGRPTNKMRHNAIGIGWYRRTFEVPTDWRGRHTWLVIGGVHRSAVVYVNDKKVADHVGYPVEFRADITDALRDGGAGPQTIVIAADSRQDPKRDPLVGTFDVIDYMNLTWGGIYEHVRLESTGDMWIADAFVQPDPADHFAKLRVSAGGHSSVADDLTCTIGGRTHKTGVRHGLATDYISLTGTPLWTPNEPNLLTLELTLSRRESGEVLDRRQIRFGLKKLEIRDGQFILNGDKFFVRGYGDDFNFPRELLPPADVELWKKYLRKRKDFGFNAVRHHSMMPSESYLTAADEIGMLVQPELPIAYMEFQQRATPEARKLYAQVWAAYIRQMANHPSVMAWCMGNEQNDGLPFGPQLYRTAKSLDPDRPVIDSDGVPPSTDRTTLDYRPVQYDEHAIPWGASRGKYAAPNPPTSKPTIVHEMSNLSCLPDPAEADSFDGTIKPFWLDAMRDAVKRQHVETQLPAMLDASWKLQASLLKLNIEAARLGASNGIGGYEQWLFRDYWTQSSGIESIVGTTRRLTADTARQFNADAVLLWDHDRVNFRCGETIDLKLVLSDFRPRDAAAIREVRARLGEETAIVLDPPAGDPQSRGNRGPWTGRLNAPTLAKPAKLLLIVEAGDVRNEWPVWIWPEPPTTKPTENVLIVPRLTKNVPDRLDAGAAVLVTNDSITFPAQHASFKPAWWRGDENGDFVHGNLFASKHPALQYFPNDGYGDLQAYALLNDRSVVKLDDLPGGITPIVAAIDVPWKLRRMAYLWEARAGRGRLLVSSFDLSEPTRKSDPAAAWMYASLVRYAGSENFRPPEELPLPWLRDHVAKSPPPVDRAVCVEGFDAVVDDHAAERSRWFTERESAAEQYVVRQTDAGRRFTWKTGPLPQGFRGETVTFVWAGGVGYRSQPDAGPFVLSMNGHKLGEVPFTSESSSWSCGDGVMLHYWPIRKTGEDSAGFFLLDVPRAHLTSAGGTIELSWSAPGKGSRRWIAVAPYRDVSDDF
jgi:beta-galactosidase